MTTEQAAQAWQQVSDLLGRISEEDTAEQAWDKVRALLSEKEQDDA